MFQSNDIDIILKILEDKIDILDRKKDRNSLIVIPKNSPIESLYITFKPIPLSLERLTVFIADIPVSQISDHQKVYQSLKSMECEIDYIGIIFKKPLFISRKELFNLKDKLKGLEIRKDLVNQLNSDKDLLKNIRKLKLHKVELKLNLVNDVDVELPDEIKVDKVSQLYEIASYYNPPSNIHWNVVIEAYLVRGLTYPKKVFLTYKILENISYKIINFSTLFINNLNKKTIKY